MVSLALLFKPSTTPLDICPLALNQLRIKGRCERSMYAIFFIGLIRERNASVHQRSKNLPAHPAERYSQNCWKSSLSRYARTAVSYTHLDVYKRQALILWSSPPVSG